MRTGGSRGASPLFAPDPAEAKHTSGAGGLFSTEARRDEPSESSRDLPAIARWVAVIAAAAAGALLFDAAPTGTPLVDAVERGLLFGVVTFAASRCPSPVLVWATAVCTVATVGTGWLFVSAVAVLCAVASFRRSSWSPAISAVAGGLAVAAVCSFDLVGAPWANVVAAVVAVAPVVVSAWWGLERRPRRIVGFAMVVLVLAIGISGVAATWVVYGQRDSIRRGVDAISAGATQLEAGNGTSASVEFDRASVELRAVDDALSTWWIAPLRAVPAVAHNLDVGAAGLADGAQLASVASDLAPAIDEAAFGNQGPGVDLVALSALEQPAARGVAAVAAVDGRLSQPPSPWLVEPLGDLRADAAVATSAILREAALAQLALEEVPVLLGVDGPRRYLMLLGNPAEARDVGGHLGNFAELSVDNGSVELVAVGRPNDLARDSTSLTDAGSSALDAAPQSLQQMQPVVFPQNWGAHPDFGEVASLAAGLFESATGRPVDGVLYADPIALAPMLQITGPVQVPGSDFVVDHTNVVDFLVRDQYLQFGDTNSANAAVSGLIEQIFDRLSEATLPGPRRMADLFGPLASSGRLQFVSLHDGEERLPDALGLSGSVAAADGGDLLGVVARNAGQNKIDAFASRSTEVNTEWDRETGAVRTTVTVTIRNNGDATSGRDLSGNGAGAPWGTNLSDLAVITPHELRSVRVDGAEVAGHSLLEGALWRHTATLSIPADGEQMVEFEVEGSIEAGDRYDLTLIGQPLVGDHFVRLGVTSLSGDLVPGPGIAVGGREGIITIDGSHDSRVLFLARS